MVLILTVYQQRIHVSMLSFFLIIHLWINYAKSSWSPSIIHKDLAYFKLKSFSWFNGYILQHNYLCVCIYRHSFMRYFHNHCDITRILKKNSSECAWNKIQAILKIIAKLFFSRRQVASIGLMSKKTMHDRAFRARQCE